MTATEKWNEICDYFESHKHCEENAIQSLWEKLFAEFFGYSSLKKEIDAHRNIQIGSTKSIIPDIIIKNKTGDLFVVELKQESLPIKDSRKDQLCSYLKLLHVDLGILICNQICIFDYDYNKPDDEQVFVVVDFEKDNPRGIKFVEIFSKENFDKDAVRDFIGKYSRAEKNISAIKQELNAELLKNLVTNYFTEKYSAEETEEALKDYVFEVTKMPVPKIAAVAPFDGHASVVLPKVPVKPVINKQTNTLVHDLKTVGKSTFVKYFKYFANPNCETGDVKQIMRQNEKWAESSFNTKSSTGKSIVNRGLGKQALQIIANSNNVDNWVIEKAKELLSNID